MIAVEKHVLKLRVDETIDDTKGGEKKGKEQPEIVFVM
jgi:hypothetical protein